MNIINLKTMILICVAMTAMLFAGGVPLYAASREDNADRLSSSQAYTFSSGYNNAAIRNAEWKVRKALEDEDKDLKDEEEKMDKEMGQNMKGQQLNKPEPKLQMKSSQQDTSRPAAEQTIEFPSGDTSPEDIPVYIRNSVQEYINTLTAAVSGTYKIKQVNQKYFVAWTDGSNCIKTQVFNSSGIAMLTTPASVTDPGAVGVTMSDLAVLSNGNVAVFWSETPTWMTDPFKFRVYDSSGNPLSEAKTIVTNIHHVYHSSINKITPLSNGNMIVFWNESNNNYLKFQTFDSNGGALSAANTISGSASTTTSVTTLDNGNVAVLWGGYDENNNHYVKSQIFYASGEGASAVNTITGDSMLSYIYSASLKNLANGNIIAFWQEADVDGNISFKSRLLNSSGNSISAANTITTDNTGQWVYTDLNITPLLNGSMALFWEESTGYGNHSIKSRMLDSTGNFSSDVKTISDVTSLNSVYIYKITPLSNGNVAVFWNETGLTYNSSFKVRVLNSSGEAASSVKTIATSGQYGSNITELPNGNLAVFWGYDALNFQVFDSSGNVLSAARPLTGIGVANFPTLNKVTILPDGSVAVFWTQADSSYRYSLKMQTFSLAGAPLSDVKTIMASSSAWSYISVSDITTLSNGEIAVFWAGNADGKYSYRSQILDSFGNFKPADILKTPPQVTSLLNTGKSNLNAPIISPYNKNQLYDSKGYGSTLTNIFMINSKEITTITKALLLNKDALAKGMMDEAGPVTAEKIIKESLNQSALSLPGGRVDPQVMEMAMKLASIMKDPTQDQKLLIDSISELLKDVNKVEQEAGQSPELTQAQDNLIQMVANVLLAQAMPDLISKGEMANIKGIFKELDIQKKGIMQSYNDATKLYFDLMKGDIERNMAALESSGIFSKGRLEQDLENASRNKMQKIIDDLRKSSVKSSEKDDILRREAEYKEKYLDPNKKKLENEMRTMMNNFTGRLQEALEAKK